MPFLSEREKRFRAKFPSSHMITHLSSLSAWLWNPISWNVAGPFAGGGRVGILYGSGGEGVRLGGSCCEAGPGPGPPGGRGDDPLPPRGGRR